MLPGWIFLSREAQWILLHPESIRQLLDVAGFYWPVKFIFSKCETKFPVSLLDLFANKKSQMLSELGHELGASKTVPAG